MDEAIREILQAHGRLKESVSELSDRADLYRAGLTSHATVNVMLALEDHFDVEFTDGMLRKQTFESIASIRLAVEKLVSSPA